MTEIANKDIEAYVGDDISDKRTLSEIPEYKDTKFMFSAAELLTNKKKLKTISEIGFNNYVRYSGKNKNRADSGSFSVYNSKKSKGVYPDLDDIIDVYRIMGPKNFDYYTVADRVTDITSSPYQIRKNILITNSNLIKMRTIAPDYRH